ncbi:MAG: hypothetical protein CM15mV3_2060 [Caudoviricetes sp.]|nr:MAG: hypothetical protein CM15mV3_2060 [Caudoviricetes sp.]
MVLLLIWIMELSHSIKIMYHKVLLPRDCLVSGSQLGSSNVSNVSVRANFGQTKFKYAAPAGFKSLCSTNLPTPAISKGSSYVDAKPYDGTGGSNPQALGFTPDFLIIKRRDGANASVWYWTL